MSILKLNVERAPEKSMFIDGHPLKPRFCKISRFPANANLNAFSNAHTVTVV